MRIELVEKIVFVFAVIAIVLVGGLVVTFSIISKESGISREEVDATIAVDDWLEKARQVANGQQVSNSKVMLLAGPVSGPAVAVVSQPGKPGAPGKQPVQQVAYKAPTGPDNYIDTSGNVPPQERADPNIPWLRRQEGVTYMKPETVPDILYQKFQSFDDAWDVAQQGGGEFVDGRYRINWIQPDSYLTTKLGLQPGDEVISVNGQPVGNSMSAGRSMYDQLKGEKRFAVKVLRGGSPTVLSFSTN